MAEPATTGDPRRRRRLALSVRGLMVLVLAIGLPLGWQVQRASAQRRAVLAVRRLGGQVLYDWMTHTRLQPPRERAPAWARQLLGDAIFQEVIGVDLPNSLLEPPPPPGMETEASRALAREAEVRHADQLACLDGLDRLIQLGLRDVGTLGPEGRARLERLDRLRYLEINGVDLGSTPSLGHLVALEELGISVRPGPAGKAAKFDLRFLDRLPALRHLALAGARVDDEALAQICRRPRLDSLGIEDASDLTDAGLGPLSKSGAMSILSLGSAYRITDAGLAHLSGLDNMQWLTLSSTPTTATSLKMLGRLPGLTMLIVSDEGFDQQAASDLKKARPGLRIGPFVGPRKR